MTLAFPPLAIFLCVTAALCLSLGIHALKQQATAFARNYAGLMFSSTAYTLGYGLELCTPDLAHMQVMLRIQYLGVPFIPYFWIGLAWAYLQPSGMPLRWKSLLLSLSGAVFLVFQTNDLHHLYYTSITYTHDADMSLSILEKGPLYWLNIAYINLGTAIGVLLLFRAWRQTVPLYRQQALMLLGGSLLPWLFHLLYQIGLSPRDIDLSPFGMAAAGIVYALAALRHRVLNILPLARDIVFDSIAEGVVVLDTRRRIIDFNHAATLFYPGLDLSMIGADSSALIDAAVFTAPDTHPFIDHRDARQLEVHCYPLRDKRGAFLGTALLIQDVSEKLALLDGLRQLASIDELTACSNRRHLIEQSTREVLLASRHPGPLALIILDIDDFKTINDTLGHLAGDEILRKVASILRQRLRSTDILGRYGGDEFIITLPETTGAAAYDIAQTLLAHCQTHCGVSLSLGIAELTPGEKDFNALLKRADLALYQAKSSGKHRTSLYQADASIPARL